MDSASASSYKLQLAVAALVGASAAAASAYYLHCRAVARLGGDIVRSSAANNAKSGRQQRRRQRDAGSKPPPPRRAAPGSSSLPDLSSIYAAGGVARGYPVGEEYDDDDEGGVGPYRDDALVAAAAVCCMQIPQGLPRLQVGPEGNKQIVRSSSSRRVGLIRPNSPKSPVASASTFESIEGSDEDVASKVNGKLDNGHPNTNGNLEGEHKGNAITENGAATPLPAKGMPRPHSISNDLHGVQPDPVAADILRKEPEQESFIKLLTAPHEIPSPDEIEVYKILQKCLELRDCYLFREEIAPWEKEVINDPCTPKPNPNPFTFVPEPKSEHGFQMVDGVVQVYADKDCTERIYPVADATTFFTDLHYVLRVTAAGNTRTVCHNRLNLLEHKFKFHLMLNAEREFLAQKTAPHRDFYNVRKVDTHVHHSACMNQKHLLRFIKSKLRKEPDEVVIFRDGTYMTLKEVFESLDLTGYDLNVDLLDVHADKSTFHRFDKFNLKYNPCGQSRLREIFLKQDNLIQGRFLAELTMQVFSDLNASKYQMAEYRISIYGRKQSEWDQLASWIVNNELYSENVVWLVQIPRLYNVYKQMGIVTSFQNLLDNIFLPLFEVTIDPSSHPQLHVLLKQVVGLDLVDDESKPERRPTKHMPTPEQWTNVFNPAFSYYAYYCYANLYTLNKLRESKGMNTIKFRPHAGEAGDVDHLAATFLLCHSISHGINLRKSPVLQYLYYLGQIGLAMSPLSNNSLFLDYHRNPFPVFFQRGLNVSLSTDDPLQIHLTKEPLVEEYSIAASLWKLSACDLCEIARNSVYQSGFSHALKTHWIGRNYYKRGPSGNDIHRTNVPTIRIEFRDLIWRDEMQLVYLDNVILPDEVDQ
ncbi:probable AMP deaminase isoform X1 [Lolium rigidum]|uniref:probable AMP deaminase isoform X1 n=1 Tax=Lolium rigidum TaxID=89674 RepID=UPI001F5D54BF|nr:probable AMP deaminase isoform X1 [Lolium rigidum]